MLRLSLGGIAEGKEYTERERTRTPEICGSRIRAAAEDAAHFVCDINYACVVDVDRLWAR